MSANDVWADWQRSRKGYRTPEHLRHVPCVICGSTRSVRGYLLGYGPSSANPEAACVDNLDGRNRCRERELRRNFPELR